MEITYSVWQISFIALFAGILIGALGYRRFAPTVKKAESVKADLEQARLELDSFKSNVGQHFDKTSELVNELTQNYVKVYQHLSEGAQTLAGAKTFSNLLQQDQGKEALSSDSDNPTADEIVNDDATKADDIEVDEHAAEFADSDPKAADANKAESEQSDEKSPEPAADEKPESSEEKAAGTENDEQADGKKPSA